MSKNFDGYKKCPYCRKLITEDAVVCKHCNKYIENNQTQPKSQKNNYMSQTTDYKLGKWSVVFVIAIFAYSFLGDVWFQLSHVYPKVSSVETLISLPGESIQKNLKQPEQRQINKGKNFRIINIQAEYTLTGMIVAKNTNFWLRNIMQNDFDKVVPLDLGIVWGDIADKKLLKKYFRFKSEKTLGQARMLHYKWKRSVNKPESYIVSHISHNHIIPANDNVTSALLRLNVWDTVKLDGYLVDIIQPSGYTSYTSLSRNDTDLSSRGAARCDGSGGACEIFYVTGVQIKDKYYK